MLALTVFSRVPLEESVRLGLVGFIIAIKGSDRLTEHWKTSTRSRNSGSNIVVVAQFSNASAYN